MPPAGFLIFGLGSETVGELAAVVGEQFDDLDGAGSAPWPGNRRSALALIGIDFNEYPACSTVDRYEQIAPCRLVRHLWQVLDIDVDEAEFLVLEGLFRRSGAVILLNQVAQVGNTIASQTAPQASAQNGWIDELASDGQQVVSGQQQRRAQLGHDQFLLWGERRVERPGQWDPSTGLSRSCHVRIVWRVTL